jgi:hypothetical protein
MSYKLVHLDWYEQYFASCCGLLRRAEAIQQRSPNSGGKPDRDRQLLVDIDGAGSECAFAKYFNLYWPAGVNTYKQQPDVFPNFDVKCMSQLAVGNLIVEQGDREDWTYVLVSGTMPDYTLLGWMLGKDVKQKQHWREHPRCTGYWVPQSDLHTIEELEVSPSFQAARQMTFPLGGS